METPPTTTPPTSTEFPKALEEVLSSLESVEKNLGQIREFIRKHKSALLLCENWTVGPTHYPTLTIRSGYGEQSKAAFNPKMIARSLGAEGWKREKNSYTCGQIDWKKTIDGVQVEIAGAEYIAPKLIEEVKL